MVDELKEEYGDDVKFLMEVLRQEEAKKEVQHFWNMTPRLVSLKQLSTSSTFLVVLSIASIASFVTLVL